MFPHASQMQFLIPYRAVADFAAVITLHDFSGKRCLPQNRSWLLMSQVQAVLFVRQAASPSLGSSSL